MGCLFYNSPFVQYRWCLAGVSPAPCPFNRTVLHALNLNSHCFPWTNIHSNGTMHHIIGSNLPILFLPPIASDCHFHIQYVSQRTLEQVDYITHSLNTFTTNTAQEHDGIMIYQPLPPIFAPNYATFSRLYLVLCHSNSSALCNSCWVVKFIYNSWPVIRHILWYFIQIIWLLTINVVKSKMNKERRRSKSKKDSNPSAQRTSCWVVYWMGSIDAMAMTLLTPLLTTTINPTSTVCCVFYSFCDLLFDYKLCV
eukprot:553063_1